MSDIPPPTQAGATHEPKAPEFAIQKVYLKDVSFEAPNSPSVFTKDWQPETNIQLNTRTQLLDEGIHEVELSVTVTTKSAGKTAYLVEVKQNGVFTAKGFAEQELGHLLGSYCPTILFPFAREAISDLVSKGGFPQMLLTPVNFDALYAQHLKQKQTAVSQGTTTSH